MIPFATIETAKHYGLLNADGPYSFLAEENGRAKRFTLAPDQNGIWCLREVSAR